MDSIEIEESALLLINVGISFENMPAIDYKDLKSQIQKAYPSALISEGIVPNGFTAIIRVLVYKKQQNLVQIAGAVWDDILSSIDHNLATTAHVGYTCPIATIEGLFPEFGKYWTVDLADTFQQSITGEGLCICK